MISLIVAVARNNAIGYRGDLIYHLSADLKRFKALTTGHSIIMGRRTFQSFPKGPLPNRRNIVLSRDPSFMPEGAEVYPSMEDALSACKDEEEIFIIGGASVYAQALPLAGKIYLTLVDDEPAIADTFFPMLTADEWHAEQTEWHEADDRHPFSYAFIDYVRKSSL